jgi:hypothetical protein
MKFTAPICAIITISIFFLQEKYTTTTTIQPHLKTPSFTMTSSFSSSKKEAQTFSRMQNLLKKICIQVGEMGRWGMLLCGCRNRHKIIFSLFSTLNSGFSETTILALFALFFLRLISSGGRSLQEDRLSQIHVSNSGESGKKGDGSGRYEPACCEGRRDNITCYCHV